MTNTQAEPDPLFDKQGLAEYLGCSVRHVENLWASRQIPAIKVGARLVRFRRSDIDKYLDEHRVEAVG